jgi:hypothetical protein
MPRWRRRFQLFGLQTVKSQKVAALLAWYLGPAVLHGGLIYCILETALLAINDHNRLSVNAGAKPFPKERRIEILDQALNRFISA